MNGSKSEWAHKHCSSMDRWGEHHSRNNSTVSKVQHQFWVTKQTVLKKFGKKEDDCIVASDAELDAKLELYRSIQDSCAELQRIIVRYHERLCCLAQEENSMGRFLKDAGKQDKTKAGEMMFAVGKALSTCGQQRLYLGTPLLSLHEKVETFRSHAIKDTSHNVQDMEKARMGYRASLSWMKNVSQQLDPDMYKQLDEFRKVQDFVKHSKSNFDRHKLDCLQKVDLLAAARCNMFSHSLILYQKALLQFAKKSADTFNLIADSFKDYQHYDFTVVKELADLQKTVPVTEPEKCDDDDKLLEIDEMFGDFEDQENKESSECKSTDNDNAVLLADLLTDALPNDNLLPSQLLAQLDFTSKLPLFSQSHQISGNGSLPPTQDSNMHTEQASKLPWLELFAELEPLSNPDAVGKPLSDADRNC
uniref:AH domain-containing protein n=1 Tax=Clastoptera arizonana TaxID=38151 RepID=A0A1B6DKG0_9HEMI